MTQPRKWWTDWTLLSNDDSNVFGPIYGAHSVQEAFYNTLQKWMPTYIAEMNRRLGSTVLLEPYEYRHRPDLRTLPRQASCAVLVDVLRTAGAPQVYQDAIRTNWVVRVTIFVYGTKDWQETQALTSAYAACIRTCIVQNRGLEGFAETTMWEGENYSEGEHSSGRTTGISELGFTVTVGNAVNMFGGLPSPQYAAAGVNTNPTTQPPAGIPTVTATDITVDLERQ